MIGIDTNVLVRFLTQDDPTQALLATEAFKSQDIYINDTVWLESEWVLRYSYGFSFDEICTAFTKVLGLPNVQVSDTQLIAQAIEFHAIGFDFADALHWLNNRHCQSFMTFDHKFANKSKTVAVSLVPVVELKLSV